MCNTKFRNIFVNIQGRTLNWSLFYRDYKGFYLENYSQFYPNWNKDSLGYPKTDKLRIIEASNFVKTIYIYNIKVQII